MDKISIIIPAYNTEKFIAKTLESAIKQTYQNLEIIIVDDQSSDNTYNICKEYAIKDSRIRLYKNEKNLGMMPNWNHALDFVTGDFWAKLDADDWWEKHFIEDCFNIISKDDSVGMVCGRYTYIDENDEIIPNSEYHLPEGFKDKSTDFVWRVKKGNDLFLPTLAQQGNCLIRTKIIHRLGKYTLLPTGDTEFYYRIGAHYKIHFIDKLYHYHRIWSQNFTRIQVISSGKSEKNLFEVKNYIFDYYYQNQKITKEEHVHFLEENEFEYNKFLIAKHRKEKNVLKFIQLLMKNFSLFPIQTIKFYISRIFNR